MGLKIPRSQGHPGSIPGSGTRRKIRAYGFSNSRKALSLFLLPVILSPLFFFQPLGFLPWLSDKVPVGGAGVTPRGLGENKIRFIRVLRTLL